MTKALYYKKSRSFHLKQMTPSLIKSLRFIHYSKSILKKCTHFVLTHLKNALFKSVSNVFRLFEFGVSLVIINCICLSFMQIHTDFYFDYIIYSGSVSYTHLEYVGKTRKYYSITKEGRALLETKKAEWSEYQSAVANVLAMGV